MNFQETTEVLHVLNQKPVDPWNIIKKIAGNVNQEDAFYVCSINDIVEKHKMWCTLLPRVKPHYAMKCNDNQSVIEILAALGAGFDCATKNEISRILALGVSQDRIVYAHPTKQASHIKYAASVGVTTMTFDNEYELYKIKSLFPNSRLVIRIRCDAAESEYNLGMKFGCDPITEAPKLLHVAKSLNLNIVGVSFHVGSGCRELDAFRRAISFSRDIFDYAESLGFNCSLVDIGGGYPGQHGPLMKEMANIINTALEEFFPDPAVEVISEPGQYYVGSAYTLACNIHSMREISQKDETTNTFKKHRMYYINDSFFGSLRYKFDDPIPLNNYSGRNLYSSSVWGQTCDGLDVVVKDMLLPEMEIGDWFIYENMGAYTFPLSCQFNGFPFPQIHYFVTEDLWSQLKDVLSLAKSKFKIANRRGSLQERFI